MRHDLLPLNQQTAPSSSVETISASPPLGAETLRPIDFAELRRRISMQQVLDLLQWRPASRSGCQLRGPCPVHGSTNERSRSFAVHVQKGVFRCFKPGCPAKGNQLDLYALATGLPILEAAHRLCQRLGTPPPLLPGPKTEKRNP